MNEWAQGISAFAGGAVGGGFGLLGAWFTAGQTGRAEQKVHDRRKIAEANLGLAAWVAACADAETTAEFANDDCLDVDTTVQQQIREQSSATMEGQRQMREALIRAREANTAVRRAHQSIAWSAWFTSISGWIDPAVTQHVRAHAYNGRSGEQPGFVGELQQEIDNLAKQWGVAGPIPRGRWWWRAMYYVIDGLRRR